MTEDLSRQAGQPLHEALWPTDLFTQGIGWVITARFKSNEVRVQAGIFLVDVFCLGAKSAEAPGKPRSKPAALCRICSNTVAQETLRT